MNHTRSFALVAAGLLCLASSPARPAAAYQQSDLQGTWNSNAIASGPGAPWWERSRAVVGPLGAFTGYANDNFGGLDTIAASLGLSAGGIVTFAGDAIFRGALDEGTTVLAGTDTWLTEAPGTTEFRVGVKNVGTYSLADLRGDWEINTIASGPASPWWQRGRVTVQPGGSFAGDFIDNLGGPDAPAGTFSITPDGIITFPQSASGRGVLDAGRTVMVFTSTWTGFQAGTVDMSVGVKMAPSYTLADLAGTWEMHGIATGPGAPYWGRSTTTIAANGTYTSVNSRSDGSGNTTNGTFAITADGVITRSGDVTARGVLDAHKTVMVWTSTWSGVGAGTAELDVATKVAGATAGVPQDAALSFTLAPVSPNPTRGGTLHVQFTLANDAPARLELLDVSGRRIANRDAGSLGVGRHTLDLAAGRTLAPGLYLVRLTQGGSARVARVVVVE